MARRLEDQARLADHAGAGHDDRPHRWTIDQGAELVDQAVPAD